MSNLAINVLNLGKRYSVATGQYDRLRQALSRNHNVGLDDVWAIRDINFKVYKGDAVAIIGRNGSGKSTLLQIISGTLAPSVGSTRVNGRVASLLELGSGFNPEFTGAENVILNGLLLGLSRSEVEGRFDGIAAFADIGKALNCPVKSYSSGMLVRLAFAVHVALEPDILIVDEALSVGDYFFQQKCFGRLRLMRENGLTLLFVSHDMGIVQNICSRTLYIKKGEQIYFGDSTVAVGRYLNEVDDENPGPLDADCDPIFNQNYVSNSNEVGFPIDAENLIWSRSLGDSSLSEDERLIAVSLKNSQKVPCYKIRMGEKFFIEIFFRTKLMEQGHIALTIKNKFDQIVTNTSSYLQGMEPLSSAGSSYAVFQLQLDANLEAGQYSFMINFGLHANANIGSNLDSTGWIGPITIDWDYTNDRAPFLGMFGVPVSGRLILVQ